jgi:hypothetical protein
MGWDGLLTYGLICNNESTQHGYWGEDKQRSIQNITQKTKNQG